MYSLEDRFKMSAKSLEALNRLRSNRTAEIQEKLGPQIKPDYSRMIFEEYTDDSFSEKVKFDGTYYNLMLSRLDESHSGKAQELIGEMMTTVRQIYEHVNIKPKLYGANRTMSLNESEDTLQETSTRILNDYVNRNYYALSAQEREQRYFNAVKPIANELVVENQVAPDVAVKFATKAVVLEGFIERISFPLVVRDKIHEYMTADDYRQLFEQDELVALWDKFKDQSMQVAKVVAATI